MRVWLTVGVVVLVGMVIAPGVWSQPGPGGGLTVKQARASKLAGVLLVRAYVVVDRSGRVRLCDRLMAAPPRCGGASLVVAGASVAHFGRLERARGIAWSSHPRGLLGRVRAGRLIIAPRVI